MNISVVLGKSDLSHMLPEQYGAFVAHVMKSERFRTMTIRQSEIEITYEIYNHAELLETSQLEKVLIGDLRAMADLEPFPCPCGCGSFIAISPCLVQVGMSSNTMMTREEHNLAQEIGVLPGHSGKILAIKAVRMRTGLGLKDAKDLVDRFYPYTPR